MCGCGSQTRIRASLPDGFEREVNPRLRASGRVIDGSACPRITTQHNRDAGTHLEISLAVPLCTCGRPTRSFICAIRTGLRIRFKVCLQCRHLVSALSALASRLFGIFAPPPPSLYLHNAPSQQMSVLLKLFKSRTIAERGEEVGGGDEVGGREGSTSRALSSKRLFHFYAFRQIHSR